MRGCLEGDDEAAGLPGTRWELRGFEGAIRITERSLLEQATRAES